MKAFCDDRQRLHDPRFSLYHGRPRPNRETPARLDALAQGARVAGLVFQPPEDRGLGPIAAIHTPEYLDFLQTIHADWVALDGASEEVIANVHPDRRSASYPASPVGRAGFHMSDTACPITADTWQSAYWSAQSALAAAAAVQAGDRSAYALCRPPGHHASTDAAGGFCFLGNAAIAAQWLTGRGARVAVLDLDVHHGNGTQSIFYARADVLTVSIHADPAQFYPFFWGHAGERGEGAGLGYNLNIPLALGSGDAEFVTALDFALGRIHAYGADTLVLALGLDAAKDDPFQAMRVTSTGFASLATRLAATGLPVVVVQEGGYLSDALGDNLTAFLRGLGAG